MRAEERANALRISPFNGMAPLVKVTVKNFEFVLRNERGIVFFKDFWRRGNETFANRTGDHIDLWNGKRLTARFTWFRIQWGFHVEGVASDF